MNGWDCCEWCCVCVCLYVWFSMVVVVDVVLCGLGMRIWGLDWGCLVVCWVLRSWLCVCWYVVVYWFLGGFVVVLVFLGVMIVIWLLDYLCGCLCSCLGWCGFCCWGMYWLLVWLCVCESGCWFVWWCWLCGCFWLLGCWWFVGIVIGLVDFWVDGGLWFCIGCDLFVCGLCVWLGFLMNWGFGIEYCFCLLWWLLCCLVCWFFWLDGFC